MSGARVTAQSLMLAGRTWEQAGALLDAIEDEARTPLVAALERYGGHERDCRWEDLRFGCTCGWDALSREYRATLFPPLPDVSDAAYDERLNDWPALSREKQP